VYRKEREPYNKQIENDQCSWRTWQLVTGSYFGLSMDAYASEIIDARACSLVLRIHTYRNYEGGRYKQL
jgi:hypothetical protein